MTDLAVTISPEILEEKLEEGRDRKRRIATWNTRRLPKRLAERGPHRLFVASNGFWRGYFPLSDEVLWNPDDAEAAYAMIFDPSGWTEITPTPARRFRGWRYLDTPPSAPDHADGSS